MSLASQVSAAMTRIGTEFKSVRTAIAGKADVSHTQAFSTITGTIADGQLPARLGVGGAAPPPTGDWNNAVDTGFYSGYDATNRPAGTAGWGLVTVHQLAGNPQYVEQAYRQAATGGAALPIYRRLRDNGTWTAWIAEVQTTDARLSDARTPLAHNQAFSTITGTIADGQLPDRLVTNALAVNANYNTVITSGWYLLDNNATNAPVAANCYVEVRAVFAQNVVEQVARVAVANTGAVVGDTYTRYMISGVWGAWVKKTAHGLSDVTWTTVACTNSWVGNYQYARRAGLVTVNLITPTKASWVANDIIASGANALPAGFRPIGSFVVKGANASGVNEDRSWYIDNVGVIRAAAAGTVSMNGMCTYIAA